MVMANRFGRLLSSLNSFVRCHPVALVFLGYVACFAIAVASPEAFIADDSYFYLEIARNISSGEGVTFNRVVPTNGFHPLWEVVLIPVAAIAESRTLYLVFALITCGILGAGAILSLYRALTNHTEPLLAAVGTLPLATILAGLGVHASEAYLNALTIGTVLYLLTEDYEDREWYPYLVGAALGLSMLARLDNVFLGAGVCMFLWLQQNFWTSVKAFGTASIVVAPYLAWNVANFGHLQPISSSTKSNFPHIGPYLGGLSEVHYLLLAALLICMPLAFFLNNKQLKTRRIVTAFGGAAIAQGVYHFLFQSSAGWYWYSILPAISFGYTFGLLANELLTSERPPARTRAVNIAGAAALVLYATGVPGYLITNKYKSTTWNADLGRHLDDSLEPNYTLVVGDWPGALQFWSDLRIISIDGLTTNHTFQRELAANGPEYLLDLGTDGVLTGPHDQKVTVSCTEQRDQKCSGWELNLDAPRFIGHRIATIPVTRQDLVHTFTLPSRTGDFRIWRWPEMKSSN